MFYWVLFKTDKVALHNFEMEMYRQSLQMFYWVRFKCGN